MSPAAMDFTFRSPITPPNVFPAIPNLQNNTRQCPERPPSTDSTSSSTNDVFNFSYVSEKGTKSSRPKPRIAKIRRPSKKSEPIGDGAGFNPTKPGPASSDSSNDSAAAGTHNANGSSVSGRGSDSSGLDMNRRGSNDHIENAKQMGGAGHVNSMFVFGANKSETCSRNLEPVSGANQSILRSFSSLEIGSSVSNSKVENVANLHSNLGQKAQDNFFLQSGTFEFEKFGVGVSDFTANGSAVQPHNPVSNDNRKSINPNTCFGDNRSSSGLNQNFWNLEFGAEQNGSATNLSSGKKEPSGVCRTSVTEMNETAASIFESHQSFSINNGFTGFVFGANVKSSSSYANRKAKKPFRNSEAWKGGKSDSEVASQKGSPNAFFVFRGNSEIGNTSCEESIKFDEDMHNSKSRKNAHIHESHKFVFSSHSVLRDGVSELSNEFDSMSIGATMANNLSGKSPHNIKNTFIFGSNQNTFGVSTECESAYMNLNNQHENVNSRMPGYDESVGKVEKTNVTSCTGKSSTFEKKKASSLGVGTQNVTTGSLDKSAEFVYCSEQISSQRSSAGINGKENKPINLNDRTSDGSQFHFPNDIDARRNAFFMPLFAPEDTGIQVNGDAAVAPSLNKDEKPDQASIKSFPFGIGETFVEFKASSSSEAFSFNVDLFSGLSNKMGCESRKYVRNKKAKKKKELGQKNLVKDQAEQQNNDSSGCGSPMDFSPYQNTSSEAEKKCHEPSENTHEADPGNHLDEKKIAISAAPSSIDGLSSIRRQYKKKYRTKGCIPTNQPSQQNSGGVSHNVQFPHLGHSSEVQSGAASNPQGNGVHPCNTDEGHAKQEFPDFKACERCRIWGNQAYKAGNLSKAEELYSKGIKSVSHSNIPECCIEPLLLCYSNRAATRMSLYRMREAIDDCASAAALDPSFLKVKLRAANCYLLLGEVQKAMEYYNNCLESKGAVCLDRRITIAAADGLQKAEKVAENLHLSAELLQQKTLDAAKGALEIIAEALRISLYSEKLLELKADTLCELQMYHEAIKLCEQTLDFAEKNYVCLNTENMDNSLKMWRWRIMSKSYYHLGKLEAALHLIEKQEQAVFVKDSSGNNSRESSIALGTTIRELLDRKKAGNEAFRSKKFAVALDHYNAAISSSVESRPFAAICYCNLAAAHQSLGQITDAIADCSVAMALDENYTKAASRRATLHEMIRDYAHAVTDLQRLISLLENQLPEKANQSGSQDRSSSGTLKELRKARQRLSSIEEKAKSETPLDLYLILGIKASDPESDIKKAYKKAALKHHPDKAVQFLAKTEGVDRQLCKDISNKVQKDADRLFKMIGEAYAVLSDSDKRSKYDYEEEIWGGSRQNSMNYTNSKSSNSYSSPFGRSPSHRRSSNRSYRQESWRTYRDSDYDWW